MSSTRWMGCVVGGAIALLGSTALAQQAPDEAPPVAPVLPPPPTVTPTAAQGAWWTPPPLAQGATWRAAATSAAAIDAESASGASTPESFVAGVGRCEDSNVVGRVVAETLAAGVGVVGTGMLVVYLANSTDNFGMAMLTLGAGITSYLVLTPLAVHGVGRTFGGNGKMWASLLGGLLVPVLGHVVGYELSHEPVCAAGPRTAHRRRAPSLAMAAADQGLRWAPVVAPTGQGGALMGLTVAF
jgi:hypothetical protein